MGIKSISKGNRIFLISFVATFLILSIVAFVIIYFPRLQTIQHLPTSYDVSAPDWMKFVVPGPDKVTLMNFTNIYRVNGTYSVFASDKLLVLLGFSTQVTVEKSPFLVTAEYPNPNPNLNETALNILKPDSVTYSALQGELNSKSSANYTYGENTLYEVTRSTSDSPAYVIGYVCLRGGYLLYSDGSEGMILIKSALDNEVGNSRLIDDQVVKAGLYVLTQEKGNELAYSYSKFSYSVSDVVSTSTTVRYDTSSIITSSLYAFNTTSTAQQDLDKIKQANLKASSFQIIDNYILVVTKYDKANLLGELRSL
ncbi:MAG: hypothetical protein ABSA11_03545 [Candidatus Bathyarchaeia archaeon]